MSTDGTIKGAQVLLRPATTSDATRFEEILAHPEVAQWWGDAEESVADQVGYLLDPDDDTSPYAIMYHGLTVGIILAFEESDPQYRHAGIDIAVDPEWQGRGFGTDAIRTLAGFLIEKRGHHRLVIDPAAHNESAIRVYRTIGFRPVGFMRGYERGPDGNWHDGLLMDMLAEELTAAKI